MARSLADAARRLSARPRAVYQAIRMVYDPVSSRRYHTDAAPKGRIRMAMENAVWSLRYGEVNRKYFLYGMDRRDGPPRQEAIPAGRFMEMISSEIRAAGAGSTAAVLKDKFLFSLITRALDYPHPRLVALVRGSAELLDPRRTVPWEELVAGDEVIDGFCKPVRGRHGADAFRLRLGRGAIHIDDEEATLASLRSRIREASLLQERVAQHETLSALYPHSVNTLRLITALRGGEVELFEAVLRIGAGGRVVDNWSSGGLVVTIDRDGGFLRGRGMFAPGKGEGWVERHPDTGVPFDGYPLPRFTEAADLVLRFHRDLGGLRTIAWDVAITPVGPTIIEANTHWDGGLHVGLDPDFQRRYLELLQSPLGGPKSTNAAPACLAGTASHEEGRQ